ncbi:DUF2079 domain-containing protein [Streptomyces sp. NPDC048266]|uniref:DUF2079 domain-containing protein n=1 Tax=Streptomyces sp. NPDC048266 TaxID=3155787 RepID=UPI0033C4D80C
MSLALPRPRQPSDLLSAQTSDGAAPGGRQYRLAWPWSGWALALFTVYALFSVGRHHNLGTTGWDLGIFDQAVRSYAGFQAPISDLKGWGYNLYGDHFHPILVLLVPLYWICPRAETLLVAQAALIAVAVIPLAALAARRMGRRSGHAIACAYGLSFGVQGAIDFDFHEVAIAAPLLAFSLCALAERRYRAAVLWALPLLLVKEELALTVAAIGLVLVWRRQWRLGALTAVLGLTWFALLVMVVIPAFNPQGVYPYMSNAAGGSHDLAYRLLHAPQLLLWPPEKVGTLLLLGALTGFLALRSPMLAVAAPTIAVRFLSDSPGYWGTGLQYNLALMPVMFAAALDAFPAWQRDPSLISRLLTRHAVPAMLAVAVVLSLNQPLMAFLQHPVQALTPTAHARAAYALMAKIPDGATVEATNHLTPHLTHRTRTVNWPMSGHDADWVILDPNETWPVTPQQQQTHLQDLLAHGYRQVDARDGILLLHRTALPKP